MPRKGKSAEGAQQAAVLQWLAVSGVTAFRMNTGVVMAEYNGRKRPIRFGFRGMADVVAFPWFNGETHPRTLWIEMKSATGRQTPEQKSFAVQVEDAGMHYLVARSVEDIEQWLTKENNLIKQQRAAASLK